MYTLNKRLLALLLLLTSPSCLTSGGSAVQLPEALIPLNQRIEKEVKVCLQHKAEKGKLYNIDPLINEDSFQKASISGKKQRAIACFITQKNSLIREIVLKYFFIESIQFSITVTGIVIIFVTGQKLKKLAKEMLMGGGGMDFVIDLYINAVMISLILTVIGFLFKKVSNLLTIGRFYYNPDELYLPVASLEEKYMSMKYFLPADFVGAIEPCFIILRNDSKRYDQAQRIEELLALINPKRREDGLLHWDQRKVDKLFEPFNPELRRQLKELAFFIMVNINLNKHGIQAVSITLFNGPPGTGKTHSAKVLAEAIGIPYSDLSMATNHGTLFGNVDQVGMLTQSRKTNIKRKYGDYTLICYDDGDREISARASSDQLALFDRKKYDYTDMYYGVSIPKPRIAIVTANYGEELESAITNRFDKTIYYADIFSVYTPAGINKILDNELSNLIAKYSCLPYSLTKKEFTRQEWEGIKQGALKATKKNQDKGFRTALSYIRMKLNQKLKKKHDVYVTTHASRLRQQAA